MMWPDRHTRIMIVLIGFAFILVWLFTMNSENAYFGLATFIYIIFVGYAEILYKKENRVQKKLSDFVGEKNVNNGYRD